MEINLVNLGKSYAKKQIFQNLNFRFELNQRYGISGLNGSGKSTLLKIISGFVTPSAGNISYIHQNQEIDVTDIHRYISYTAPYIDIPTDLSWFELLDFHFSMRLRLHGISNEEINSFFQLPTHLPLRQFSSGMLQRAKLGIAFFTDSKIILLDEPTETLDLLGADLYQKLLKNHTQNRTVIVASNKNSDFIDCKDIINILDYTS